MLEINTLIEMQIAFDGLISRLDMLKGRISEIEDISVGTPNTKKQRGTLNTEKQRLKEKQTNKHNRISKKCGPTTLWPTTCGLH